MPRDVVLHEALLEGTGTQMDKPLAQFGRDHLGDGEQVAVALDEMLSGEAEYGWRR